LFFHINLLYSTKTIDSENEIAYLFYYQIDKEIFSLNRIKYIIMETYKEMTTKNNEGIIYFSLQNTTKYRNQAKIFSSERVLYEIEENCEIFIKNHIKIDKETIIIPTLFGKKLYEKGMELSKVESLEGEILQKFGNKKREKSKIQKGLKYIRKSFEFNNFDSEEIKKIRRDKMNLKIELENFEKKKNFKNFISDPDIKKMNEKKSRSEKNKSKSSDHSPNSNDIEESFFKKIGNSVSSDESLSEKDEINFIINVDVEREYVEEVILNMDGERSRMYYEIFKDFLIKEINFEELKKKTYKYNFERIFKF
jgi:hypothetical protein